MRARRDRTGAPVKEVKIVVVHQLGGVEDALGSLRNVARGLLVDSLRRLALRVKHAEVVHVALLGGGCLALVGEDLRALRSVNIGGSVRLARAEGPCGDVWGSVSA